MGYNIEIENNEEEIGFDIAKSDLDSILEKVLEKIFETKKFADLSKFQKRQCVFDYLVKNNEYDFELLKDIYFGKNRKCAKEIVSALYFEDKEKEDKGKSVCNGFSYAYKLLLDKLQIPCMLASCYILEDSDKDVQDKYNIDPAKTSMIENDSDGRFMIPHMLVLVQNDDGTFSFDDITYAIFNKETGKEQNYFNYDYKTALQNRQVNLEGVDTDILRAIVTDSKDTESDKLYRKIYINQKEPRFFNNSNEFS